MNCRYCNAEIPENETLCPVCGKEQAEENVEGPVVEMAEETAEAAAEDVLSEECEEMTAQEEAEELPKKNPRKTAAVVIACILLAAIVIGLFAGVFGGAANTEPTEAAVVIPSSGDPASSLCKSSYTVSDKDAATAANVVVATMGDKELTNGELQSYYWQEIYMFLEENYSYAMYMGLDLSKPLDQQLMQMGEASLSWQQFFLDGAISTWKNYQALALEAAENNHKLPAERQEELNNLEADLKASAASNGFGSADEMLKHNVGANCTVDNYLNYVKTCYQGMSYYQDYCEALDPSDAEIEAYYAENEDAFVGSGITKDAKFVNVRHVLLQPEGGETGENGYPVFTDEAWEACLKEAEELYNKWQEGDKSEESFAQLANEYTEDGNDANGDGVPDGGLYEDVYVDMMVPEFNDWCFDESRQVGDHGLVKTVYGYHIMFFSAHRNWMNFAENDLINNLAYEKLPATLEKYPATVDFSLVELAAISFE